MKRTALNLILQPFKIQFIFLYLALIDVKKSPMYNKAELKIIWFVSTLLK